MRIVVTLVAVVAALCLLPAAEAQTVKGVWATYYDLQRDGFTCDKITDNMKAAGFNTLYVSVWWQGRVFFPSTTSANITGMQQKDYLSDCVRDGKGSHINEWITTLLLLKAARC